METPATQPRTFPLRGSARVPGDKSISHRAVLLAAMAKGHSVVRNFLIAADTLATVRCCRQLGVTIEVLDGDLHVDSPGCSGWTEPAADLDVGNSGTTIRLLLGMLAGRPFTATLTGDAATCRRPMERVMDPLARMGATFLTGRPEGHAPITMRGGRLSGLRWEAPVASAQVKSALLLAGLQAYGATVLWEPAQSRNHTEVLLPRFGATIETDHEAATVMVKGPQQLRPATINVPGDFSSAAFLLAAAVLRPGSDLTLQSVGLNPTRVGLLRVLKHMGVQPEIRNLCHVDGELTGDVHAAFQPLHAAEVPAAQVPQLVDEIPVLAVAATQARGTTIVRGAGELRYKESDRLSALQQELGKMGAALEVRGDDLLIPGPFTLRPAALDSHGDHRLAMALAVADLVAGGGSTIAGRECVETSFPRFFEMLAALQGTEREA